MAGWRPAGIAGLLIAVAFAAGSAQLATAHTTTYASSLTLGVGSVGSGPNEETVWWGTVNSDKPSCEPSRKVKLFRDTAETGPDTLIDSDKTDGDGYWQINVSGYPPPDGTYYATTRAKALRKNTTHRHTCTGDRSNELVVPGPDIDYDGDGYFIVHGDCDDNNPAVNPGETETDNDIDDNCDGQVDEGFAPPNPNDPDNDNVDNPNDNCPDVANTDQADADLDAKGDACDACPASPNPGSEPCPIEKASLLIAERRLAQPVAD